MLNRRATLLATAQLLPIAVVSMAKAQAPAPSSPAIDTRIGTLRYENGYPTNETVGKLYDAIDFQRACQAYLWGFPLVSAASIRRGLFQNIGAT